MAYTDKLERNLGNINNSKEGIRDAIEDKGQYAGNILRTYPDRIEKIKTGIDPSEIPIASKEQRGVVQIGDGLSVTEDGIVSFSGDSIQLRTGEQIANVLGTEYSGTILCTEDYNDMKVGCIYIIELGEIVQVIAGGGGGGGQQTNTTETISELEQNIAVGKNLTLRYYYESTAIGKGTARLYVNSVLKSTKIIENGENSFDVSQYIKEGTNYITIMTVDSNSSSVRLEYVINGVKLTLRSSFNPSLVYSEDIDFRYTLIGVGEKTVSFEVDDNIVDIRIVRTSGEELQYVVQGLRHGIHKFRVFATMDLNGQEVASNVLEYKIIYSEEGVTTPIISSTFNQTEAMEGEMLNIDYLIYDPLNGLADATLSVTDGATTQVKVDRTVHYWSVSNYPTGHVQFIIACRGTQLILEVEVEPVEIDIEPVTENLMLYLTAANRSNSELEDRRKEWNFEDVQSVLTNFNWSSNGWMNGTLKCTGDATVYVPLEIFKTDLKRTGATIEFEFATHNVSDLTSTLISCYSNNKGIKITSTECIMKSEQETVKARFKENEKYRISIVIDNMNSNRLIKTYVNGVLSGIAQYGLQDNFQQASPVGITINENREEIDVYSIRVYKQALSSRQILNNYIYDITDVTEKLAKFQSNNVYDVYGNISLAKLKSMIPILEITGPLPRSKGDKQTVSTIYSDPVDPTRNFEYEGCTIDVQGTSSQYFPKKNYKIKFPQKFSFYKGAIPEKTYTFKADYMESSHSHNTGNGVFINDLYEEMFPTQTSENGVRNCIYGFPCSIFYRANEESDYEYFGAYNFNNDKTSPDTLGLTTENAESWEFCNNTSNHCLLRDNDFTPEAKPEDDFEARHPKSYEDNPNWTALKRAVDWIVSTNGNINKFKTEFPQYFNLYYSLIYYVIMEFGLMVDSRAKNMFFDTVDGVIWYPRFYDMDTCFGLNNEGVLEFGYWYEMHDSVGSLKVYNGENSLFWNNFEEAFANEIKSMYLSLRASGKLSYDTVMKVFKEHQIDKFNEAQLNEDAVFKYINPVTEEGNTTYLYAAQGTRLSHFQWWVSNRIQYLDSKYETPEYISDFVTMRLYTSNGDFSIMPYTGQYLKIKFGSTNVKVRGYADVSTTVPAPFGLVFNDTETIIYGGSNISDLGDLATKYPGTVDVSKASKLRRLKIGNPSASYKNTNLRNLELGNNNLLTEIDVRNCPNLSGNLDVSGCKKLENFYATGTSLTGVTFVDGGDLKNIQLPGTMTSVIIKNHMSIENLDLESWGNLQTLVLKNTNLDAWEVLKKALSVKRIYITFDREKNIKMQLEFINYLINNCTGIDDNGMGMPHPNLQGYLTIQYNQNASEAYINAQKQKVAEYFPALNVTWEPSDTSVLNVRYYPTDKIAFVYISDFSYDGTLSFPSKQEIEEEYGYDVDYLVACPFGSYYSGTLQNTHYSSVLISDEYDYICNRYDYYSYTPENPRYSSQQFDSISYNCETAYFLAKNFSTYRVQYPSNPDYTYDELTLASLQGSEKSLNIQNNVGTNGTKLKTIVFNDFKFNSLRIAQFL